MSLGEAGHTSKNLYWQVLDQLDANWSPFGRGTSVEKIPLPDWLWASPWGIFLIDNKCGRAQLTVGQYHPTLVILDAVSKQAEQQACKQCTSFASSILPCLHFRPASLGDILLPGNRRETNPFFTKLLLAFYHNGRSITKTMFREI